MMVQEIPIKKLYIQYARTQSKKCAFSRRSAPVWNTKLSQLTKCCTNVIFFKRLLDNETLIMSMNLQCESKYIIMRGRLKATSLCLVPISITFTI